MWFVLGRSAILRPTKGPTLELDLSDGWAMTAAFAADERFMRYNTLVVDWAANTCYIA